MPCRNDVAAAGATRRRSPLRRSAVELYGRPKNRQAGAAKPNVRTATCRRSRGWDHGSRHTMHSGKSSGNNRRPKPFAKRSREATTKKRNTCGQRPRQSATGERNDGHRGRHEPRRHGDPQTVGDNATGASRRTPDHYADRRHAGQAAVGQADRGVHEDAVQTLSAKERRSRQRSDAGREARRFNSITSTSSAAKHARPACPWSTSDDPRESCRTCATTTKMPKSGCC